jgi:hypothetical protein
MHDPRDFKLDIKGLPDSEPADGPAKSRPFLSILFDCCKVYQRIYLDPKTSAYTARCPRCMRSMEFKVGAGGTSERRFVVR